jgi:hypothetical protein
MKVEDKQFAADGLRELADQLKEKGNQGFMKWQQTCELRTKEQRLRRCANELMKEAHES